MCRLAVQAHCVEQPLWLSGGALGACEDHLLALCCPAAWGNFAGVAESGQAFETRCASPVTSDKFCSKESHAVSLTPVSLTPFTPRHPSARGGTRGCSKCGHSGCNPIPSSVARGGPGCSHPRMVRTVRQVPRHPGLPRAMPMITHTHTPRGDDGDSGLPRLPSPPCRCWAESLFPAHPCILTLNARTPPRGVHCPAPGQWSALLPVPWL